MAKFAFHHVRCQWFLRVVRPTGRFSGRVLLHPSYCSIQAEWFLGPNVKMLSPGYGCAEGWVGLPYDPYDLEHYKLKSENITEFLDINKGDSIDAIVQAVSTLLR